MCDSDLCRRLTRDYSRLRPSQLMLTWTDDTSRTEILHSLSSGVHRSEEWGIQNRESKVIEQQKIMHFLASDFRAEEFPGGVSSKESTCPCRRCKRHGFSPWVGKILWRRAWQPTPVFLFGEIPWTEKPGGLSSIGSQSQT